LPVAFSARMASLLSGTENATLFFDRITDTLTVRPFRFTSDHCSLATLAQRSPVLTANSAMGLR
jgi:hypothetical protein